MFQPIASVTSSGLLVMFDNLTTINYPTGSFENSWPHARYVGKRQGQCRRSLRPCTVKHQGWHAITCSNCFQLTWMRGLVWSESRTRFAPMVEFHIRCETDHVQGRDEPYSNMSKISFPFQRQKKWRCFSLPIYILLAALRLLRFLARKKPFRLWFLSCCHARLSMLWPVLGTARCLDSTKNLKGI